MRLVSTGSQAVLCTPRLESVHLTKFQQLDSPRFAKDEKSFVRVSKSPNTQCVVGTQTWETSVIFDAGLSVYGSDIS